MDDDGHWWMLMDDDGRWWTLMDDDGQQLPKMHAYFCRHWLIWMFDVTFIHIILHLCQLLSIIVHQCPSSSIVVHQHPSMSIIVHCCPLLSIIVHFCPSLSINVHQSPSLSIMVHRCRDTSWRSSMFHSHTSCALSTPTGFYMCLCGVLIHVCMNTPNEESE